MNQIRSWLYIGKYRETKDFELLSECGIEAMLLLAELVEHPGINSTYLPVEDGVPIPEELLQQGVQFVLAEKQKGRRVLVACGAGISRSAAFATAVLKEIEPLSLLEAFLAVKAVHPIAMPHPAVWKSLCDHYGESIPWFKIA